MSGIENQCDDVKYRMFCAKSVSLFPQISEICLCACFTYSNSRSYLFPLNFIFKLLLNILRSQNTKIYTISFDLKYIKFRMYTQLYDSRKHWNISMAISISYVSNLFLFFSVWLLTCWCHKLSEKRRTARHLTFKLDGLFTLATILLICLWNNFIHFPCVCTPS